MICVSDRKGINRDVYDTSKVTLTKHLKKFGWEFRNCVAEEDDKV